MENLHEKLMEADDDIESWRQEKLNLVKQKILEFNNI